ncbi:3'-5' exonuclease [Leptospira wolffii]|uniref:3'-5' exonuclease n=1 Tax=Leptospira wolffii TaxID=409998 RepID=A0ABV5BU68_9LEPT
MIVLGLDFETNGINPNSSEILEIGAALWDTERKEYLSIFSSLIIPQATHFEIKKETKELTGITEDDLYKFGIPLSNVIEKLIELSSYTTILISHFGIEFDRIIYERILKKTQLKAQEKFWIDTGYDIQYPKKITTRKLQYLALEHGFIPGISHRALFDVISMFQVVGNYNFPDILENANSPLLKITASVEYEKKDLAFRSGFHWNSEKKVWEKLIRESIFRLESYSFPTKVEQIFYRPLTFNSHD